MSSQKWLPVAITLNQTQAAWSLAQNIWYGISLGSVLLLAAIGLAITFGVMGVINMAQGELVPDEVTIKMLLERISRADAKAGANTKRFSPG